MPSEVSFKPVVRSDGTLDPGCLELAGERWITEWLRSRLSGIDPWFPVDKRSDEDPEAFVVGIVRDAGLAHPAVSMISHAARRLLDEARSMGPEAPPFMPALLRLFQRARLPAASDWFTEEIRFFARNPEEAEERWGAENGRDILRAAVRQAPGLPRTAAREVWLQLLNYPSYATLALLALASSIEARASLLQDWWQSAPPQERGRELRQIVFHGLKSEGEEQVRSSLKDAGQEWGPDLQGAVNEALRQLEVEEVFTPETEPLLPSDDLARRALEMSQALNQIMMEFENQSRFALEVSRSFDLVREQNQSSLEAALEDFRAAVEQWQAEASDPDLIDVREEELREADELIQKEVWEILGRNNQLDSEHITVYVDKGEITLEGTVGSRFEKRLAESLLEFVPGMRDIHNRLQIEEQEGTVQMDLPWDLRSRRAKASIRR